LLGEGVQRLLSSPQDGWTFGLIGNGQVRVTGAVPWRYVLNEWRELEQVTQGWRALAFRDPMTHDPVVLMRAQDLARLLVTTEDLARQAGRGANEVGD
jgi:hypothetical protein